MKDVEAVFVTVPLFVHFPVTRDALKAGKHVFCEKCLVFKPDEVHALRTLAVEHPKQMLQTGLQRRYSYFYQTVKRTWWIRAFSATCTTFTPSGTAT